MVRHGPKSWARVQIVPAYDEVPKEHGNGHDCDCEIDRKTVEAEKCEVHAVFHVYAVTDDEEHVSSNVGMPYSVPSLASRVFITVNIPINWQGSQSSLSWEIKC